MLLTEKQTEEYLYDMIKRYDTERQDAVTSEAEGKKKAYESMRIVLFGDDYDGSKREEAA